MTMTEIILALPAEDLTRRDERIAELETLLRRLYDEAKIMLSIVEFPYTYITHEERETFRTAVEEAETALL